MPIPLVIAGWVAGAAAATRLAAAGASVAVLAEEVYPRVKKMVVAAGPELLQGVVDGMGIELDAQGGLNDETITAAINRTLLSGTGIELESVFDRKKMLKGFEKIAIKKVAEELGLGPVDNLGAVTVALREWLTNEVGAQLAAQAGAVVDAAIPAVNVAAMVALGKDKKEGWNTPRDFTPEGIDNRARQAKYRATHTRHWVQR